MHSHWYEDDAEALESLGVDAAIFVGKHCHPVHTLDVNMHVHVIRVRDQKEVSSSSSVDKQSCTGSVCMGAAGDFGEEAVGLIRRVADVPTPKAVILGNHDAWYLSITFSIEFVNTTAAKHKTCMRILLAAVLTPVVHIYAVSYVLLLQHNHGK